MERSGVRRLEDKGGIRVREDPGKVHRFVPDFY